MSRFTKVTICATSGALHDLALLAFRHPTGGVQLPAGSVEQGETPESAALRELLEETGIDRVTALECLSFLSTDLGSSNGVLLQSAVLKATPWSTEPVQGTSLRRGLPVRVLTEEAGAALICYEEFDYDIGVWV